MIRYTHREELWNSWSHAAGTVLGVVVGSIMVYMCFDGNNPVSKAGVIL